MTTIIIVNNFNIYPQTFDDFIDGETLDKCLPGIYDKEEGVRIYRNYYTEDDEKNYGVISLRVGKIF